MEAMQLLFLENGEMELERQYLIKWLGWSHLHNTWESENSLKLCNAKGLKKIDNYMKRLRDIEEWFVSIFEVFWNLTWKIEEHQKLKLRFINLS